MIEPGQTCPTCGRRHRKLRTSKPKGKSITVRVSPEDVERFRRLPAEMLRERLVNRGLF